MNRIKKIITLAGEYKFWEGSLIIIYLFLALFFHINRKQGFSTNYTGPYLSAASNLTFGGEFLIDTSEVNYYKSIDNYRNECTYRFRESTNLVNYNHNPVGYIYVIYFSKLIFGSFLGDVDSLILLQVLVNLFLFLYLIKIIKNKDLKILLSLFYLINPLIIYFVTFNFYYFWQVLPFFGILVLLNKSSISKIDLIIFCLIFLFTIIIRPVLIPLVALIIAVGLIKKAFRLEMIFIAVFSIAGFLIIFKETKKNFWHTAYVGIGAYPNVQNIRLNDDDGYELFFKKTGIDLDVKVGGNYYEIETIDKYTIVTKDEFLGIAGSYPFMIARNAIINTFCGFSLGYLVGANYLINIVISISGFLFSVFLIFRKRYYSFFGILFGTITYTLIYPPTQAYMFGCYIIICYELSLFISETLKKYES